MAEDLEECCQNLESSKATNRKRGVDLLQRLMENKSVLKFLDKSGANSSWNIVVGTVHKLLIIEAEKLLEDERRKKAVSASNAGYTKRNYGDLLILVIRKANTKAINLNVTKLIDHVTDCFNINSLRQYFSKTYLTILKDYILSVKDYHEEIKSNEWAALFYHLKLFYLNPLPSVEEVKLLQCMRLLLQWGPLHSMPSIKLRQEFPLITKIAEQITISSSRLLQETILKLLLEFFYQTAEDNRMACCKMGEHLFTNFVGLYQQSQIHDIKILFLEFLLFQVKIHHPKGAIEGCISAYAYSWTIWHQQLRSLYSVLCDQINNNIHVKFKPTTVFSGQQKDADVVHGTFLILFINVFNQVFHEKHKDLTETTVGSESDQQPNKRRKIESGIPAIIRNIQESKEWPWINVITELLKQYPKLITATDYISLLRTLSSLQSECKYSNVRHHLCECLTMLVDVEAHIDVAQYSKDINSLWSIIWEGTLRSAGLNQNEEQTHRLLQKLMVKCQILNSTQLFETYTSSVINVTKYSLQTLNMACMYFGLPESSSNKDEKRKILIKWILSVDFKKCTSTDVFSEEIMAQVLISLILKQWPIIKTSVTCNNINNNKISQIEDIYMITFFGGELVLDKDNKISQMSENHKCDNEQLYCSQTGTFDCLIDSLCDIVNSLLELEKESFTSSKNICNIAILLGNISSFAIHHNLLLKDDFLNHRLANVLKLLIDNFCKTLIAMLEKLSARHFKEMIDIFSCFQKLLSSDFDDVVIFTIRKNISEDLLGELIEQISSFRAKEKEDGVQDGNRRQFILLNIINVLASYSYISDMKYSFDNREYMLNALTTITFDPKLTFDREMIMTFLLSLKKFKVGTLSDKSINSILECIQKICKVCYKNYNSALKILNILYDLYPHIAASHDKTNAMILLQLFYDEHRNYGPKISTAIIDCMGQLYKLDSNGDWVKWDTDTEMAIKIAGFLSSGFQQVRLSAIKNLHIVLNALYKNDLKLTRQNAIFDAICNKCREVFDIDGNGDLSQERQIDETVTRTASVLHAFAAISATNPILRQKSLFALLELVWEKKLSMDSTHTILEMVAKHLYISNTFTLIETNLEYLISCWYNRNYAFSDFPFSLLQCANEMEFYAKYSAVMFPILIASNLPLLTSICNHIREPIEKAVETSFPNIIARYLLLSTAELIGDNVISAKAIEYKNKSLTNLQSILDNDRLSALLVDQLDVVIGNVLQFCFDPKDIQSKFSIDCPLSEPHPPFFSVRNVLKTIDYIQTNYLNDKSLIFHCAENCPEKLQKLLLHMIAIIHTSTTIEEKIKAFHRCTIIIDLIMLLLKQNTNHRVYLIRTISYTLIHLIKNNYEEDSIVNITCARYLSFFISEILPENADVLEKFLVTFVSILVPIAKCNNNLSLECTNLLNLIIVEHADNLVEAIKTLDPFPQGENFIPMQEVYERVKYNNKSFSLENEIEHFLNTGSLIGSSGYRTEGLKHLKYQLSSKKIELKELYSKLHDVRGFSEDCEKSILHRLICVLVKLSLSSNSNECIEATRCLGELGPADLLTTVLQTEQRCRQEKWEPFVLVTGCIVALLSKYIVDNNIEVVKVSSKALYYILDCKEGKTVLASQIDYGHGIVNKSFLTPFISTKKIKSDYSLSGNFENVINSNVLWCPDSSISHSQWIIKLVCTILGAFTDKCYLNKLIPVCRAKVEFSEHLLPLLVYLILSFDTGDIISIQMRNFFEAHWNISLFQQKTEVVAMNKLSVQCMLNVVNFIRLRTNIENKHFGNLLLNYLHVAQAAQFCTAHFTALLYVDLWCQEKLNEIRSDHDTMWNYSLSLTPLDLIFQREEPNIRHALKNILRESYKEVGEFDALRTCETIGLLDSHLTVEHYEQLQQWDQVALVYDIQVSHGNTSCVPKLLNALKNCNLYQLPLKYDHLEESQYECAWRLSNWNINYKNDAANSKSFEKYKYISMKALHDDDTDNFNCAISEARSSIISCLRHASLESSKNVYEPLSQLQSLLELEDFMKAKSEENIETLLCKWEFQDEINRNEFQYVEPICTQRIVILNDLVKNQNETFKDDLIKMCLKLAAVARVEGKQNVASRTLGNLRHIGDLTIETQNKITMEEAQLCWLNDKTMARYMLRNLLNKSIDNEELHAAALKLYGTWMAESCSENANLIISNYFKKSIDILAGLQETGTNCRNMYEAYDVLARFADLQYQQVISYIKSSSFESKVENMNKSKVIAQGMKIRSSHSKKLPEDEVKAMVIHERQSTLDKTEIDNTYEEKNTHLNLAMKYYMESLQHSDDNNLRMFRVLSLWFENKTNTDLNKLLQKYLSKIPSYKYIPILPQLIPHITNSEEEFGDQINAIIERCAINHPHHTLPIILSLAHNKKDRKYHNSKTNTTSNELRIAGAQKLIDTLKKGHNLKQLIDKMEALAEALISLAYLEEGSCKAVNAKKKIFAIPCTSLIMRLKGCENVLVPTYTLPIKKNCDYTSVVGVCSFEKTFAFVGGLNAPKCIKCLGTDGNTRVQLVKGKDDLRQDAVMQQVFSIMNEFLHTNKQTSKLLIRTYKVLPLSQRSGILEWVPNSMSLSEFLVGADGKIGAHEMYNPGDIKPKKCREEFSRAAKYTNEKKLAVYKNICKRFQPVFHKFFEKSFVQPAVWYERQRAYINSVATSSMCGYILGLGDRHVQNILIDVITAEVVHIDFGIAFEQGLILPTQETVPFRLTRDIEAGMGVSGVEGAFRKSCERTLEVLRKNTETIITILEVLLYDPLYTWTITPAQAYKRQHQPDHNGTVEFNNEQETTSINKTAERALLRLRQKLEGTAERGATSIEGQVEKLIQQARDPSNLCRLYQGWQPYL